MEACFRGESRGLRAQDQPLVEPRWEVPTRPRAVEAYLPRGSQAVEVHPPQGSPAEEAAAVAAVVAMGFPQQLRPRLAVTEAAVAAAVAVVATFVFVLPVELSPVVVPVSAFVD